MNQHTSKEAVQSLKWFLIRRFVIIMLFIFICEELLSMAYRVWIAPLLVDTMHVEILTVTTDDGNLMLLTLKILFLAGVALLPENISRVIQAMTGINLETGMRINITSSLLDGVSPMIARLYQFAVIIIFALLLIITLLPYIISAYWYYKTVSGKVGELLQAQEEQQEEYDRQRNLLLSDIAHDIKTPITTVSGYARALADGVVPDEEKRKEYLNAIYAKSIRVDELINLLFEYVRLDSSGFKLNKEPVDPGELLRENIALLYSDFEEKGMQLEIDIPEKEVIFELDKIQFSRVIANILTNSVKYNGANTKVRIKLNIEPHIQIIIADNGIPIDDELAMHIFEPFSRGDKSRSSRGGSGLGLSIAHKIVHMHGGKLELKRDCGDGYTKAFVITLS
ncbi:MAG: HAMP domain-containing histidine kinase [Lachnospiraceae bacterium]|nr:HAMP domain-containing histidine kinase [Lachnospiraceae bacterium]